MIALTIKSNLEEAIKDLMPDLFAAIFVWRSINVIKTKQETWNGRLLADFLL